MRLKIHYIFLVLLLACSDNTDPIPVVKLDCLLAEEKDQERTVIYTYRNSSHLSRIEFKDHNNQAFTNEIFTFKYKDNKAIMHIEDRASHVQSEFFKEFIFSKDKLSKIITHFNNSIGEHAFAYKGSTITLIRRSSTLDGQFLDPRDSVVLTQDAAANIMSVKVFHLNAYTPQQNYEVSYEYGSVKNPWRGNLFQFDFPAAYLSYALYFNTNMPTKETYVEAGSAPQITTYTYLTNNKNYPLRFERSSSNNTEFNYSNCD